MSLNDTGFDYQGSVSSNWANGEISRRDAIIATQDSELSTLRAENERLRERCEAAERVIDRGGSLARWVLLTNANGRLNLGTEDVAYVQKISDDCSGWLPDSEKQTNDGATP